MSNNIITQRVNSYIAVLIITIAGAAATMLIVHIVNSKITALSQNSEAAYLTTHPGLLD